MSRILSLLGASDFTSVSVNTKGTSLSQPNYRKKMEEPLSCRFRRWPTFAPHLLPNVHMKFPIVNISRAINCPFLLFPSYSCFSLMSYTVYWAKGWVYWMYIIKQQNYSKKINEIIHYLRKSLSYTHTWRKLLGCRLGNSSTMSKLKVIE